MKFPIPIEDRIILLPDPVVEVSHGVILVEQEAPRTGKIMAVGKGKQAEDTGVWIEMGVKEGDRVMFGRFSGASISLDGTEYLILKQSELLLIL